MLAKNMDVNEKITDLVPCCQCSLLKSMFILYSLSRYDRFRRPRFKVLTSCQFSNYERGYPKKLRLCLMSKRKRRRPADEETNSSAPAVGFRFGAFP